MKQKAIERIKACRGDRRLKRGRGCKGNKGPQRGQKAIERRIGSRGPYRGDIWP
jgi:hypothetical protein